MNDTTSLATLGAVAMALAIMILGRVYNSFKNGNSLYGAVKDTIFGTNVPKQSADVTASALSIPLANQIENHK